MLGFGNKSKSQTDLRKEQQDKQREIDEKKEVIRKILLKLRASTPEEAEQLVDLMKKFCDEDKILPQTFKRDAIAEMRGLECTANMRAADVLIRRAAAMRSKEELSERGKKLGESRRYFAKACTLGCTPSWKGAYQRMSETIMLSGGVSLQAPSRAKPKPAAPPPPNRAKA